MIMCKLTRKYLTSRTQDPLLPVTVTDQIRLWEREKNRVQTEQGASHLY